MWHFSYLRTYYAQNVTFQFAHVPKNLQVLLFIQIQLHNYSFTSVWSHFVNAGW